MKPIAAVIIPAAGSGTRMKTSVPKQFLLLSGTPILIHTVSAFTKTPFVADIVIVVPAAHIVETRTLLQQYHLTHESIRVVPGGRRRQDSVLAGLDSLGDGVDIVMVHDGARPFVSRDLIGRVYDKTVETGAAIAAVPVKDTLKKEGENGLIAATIDRSSLWQAQTPQGARKEFLREGYRAAGGDDVTDEASLLERAGCDVALVLGEETNIKITRPEDLLFGETIMNRKQPGYRIGHGFDAHRFAPDRELILGGVKIPHHAGLAGHSDADVLTHALCDALLGAIAEGDIGRHFPDNDNAFKNISSLLLLDEVVEKVRTRNLSLFNADITVICQEPRLSPHIEKMRIKLSEHCRTDIGCLNIKATTTEKMGYTGRAEGISCHAVVMLGHQNLI